MKVTVRVPRSVTARVATSTIHKTAAVVGIQGPGGAMIEIDFTGLEDGSVLVYNAASGKWVAQTLLNKQQIDMGDESY